MSEFHRITVQHWQHILGIASLMLFFCTFLFSSVRAWHMPRQKLTHLENLPLDDADSSDHE